MLGSAYTHNLSDFPLFAPHCLRCPQRRLQPGRSSPAMVFTGMSELTLYQTLRHPLGECSCNVPNPGSWSPIADPVRPG